MVFSCRYHILGALASVLFVLPVIVHGWGVEGHLTVCRIAQARLSDAAAAAVKELLPASAENDLGSLCSWADNIKKIGYGWASPLHYLNTPDGLCNYNYTRDCKDADGISGRCVAGGINNYTAQLLDYGKSYTKYNLTEALLFLSHFIGDIHQPLHTGFISDQGGNKIKLQWYNMPADLHHESVWDDNIIETAAQRFFDSDIEAVIRAIQTNITKKWAHKVQKWEKCKGNKISCPDKYASEGIKTACAWAYKNATAGSILEDPYFESRLPIVYQQLAKGGVRLAAILNRIFVPMTNVN